MGSRNAAILKKGHAKAIREIHMQLTLIGYSYAKQALKQAVLDWDEIARGRFNLTGNTRNGFVAAVYWNGRLINGLGPNPMTVKDIEGYNVRGVTSPTTRPGAGGFKDYSSGETIESVNEYSRDSGWSFMRGTDGRYSRALSLKFVNSSPIGKTDGVLVVLANSTPYGEYLVEARKLDILTTQSSSGAIDAAIKNAVSQFANYLERK